jgi:hypothetical protein
VQDRYALDDAESLREKVEIKKGLAAINYKDTKIIEGEKKYSAEKLIFQKLNSSGALEDKTPQLVPISGTSMIPNRDLYSDYFDIAETLYFNIDHVPLSFTLELPSLLINGEKVPLPVCYFEPYDLYSDSWASS